MWKKILVFLQTIHLHWIVAYGLYFLLIWFKVFGWWPCVGYTVLLIVLNPLIHKLDITV